MRIEKNALTIITLLILSVSTLLAKSHETIESETSQSNGLPINIIQLNQEEINGRLIKADGAYLVFENILEEAVQLIPRSEVQILETNLNRDIFAMLNSHDPAKLIDTIELNDGSKIACIILDIGSENVQYFTGNSLKRHQLKTSNIYSLHLDQNSVEIPFPVFAANEPTL